MRIENYRQYPLFSAIISLNESMAKENLPPITLNVVGGFALMIHNIRNRNQLTDIDYVGTDLPIKVKKLSEDIGVKEFGDPHWLNNDLMLTGTDMDDLEYSTGELHFLEAFDLSHIKVNVLSKEDLLRMKLISIDTALSAIELGGDFTRFKDFNDIKLLLSGTQCDLKGFIEENREHIINNKTYNLINEYLINGLDAVTKFINQVKQVHQPACQDKKEYARSPYLDNLLDKIIIKNDVQKKSEYEYTR